MEEQQRLAYLKAMGITAWVPKASEPLVEAIVQEPIRPPAPQVAATPAVEPPTPPVNTKAVASAPTEVTTEAPWLDDAPPCLEELSPTVEFDDVPPDVPQEQGLSQLGWDQLKQRVAECKQCDLHKTRSQTVFGVGDPSADLLIIGEAPGAEEDKQGEPFVGRAGKLLNAMLRAMGFKREQVFIANILKCRPPGNRDPHKDEEAHCQAYLARQVELIKPKAILAVGRIAAQHLLSSQEPLGRLRDKSHKYNGLPLVVTYHPAYLLRSPDKKGKAWQDLQQALGLLS